MASLDRWQGKRPAGSATRKDADRYLRQIVKGSSSEPASAPRRPRGVAPGS